MIRCTSLMHINVHRTIGRSTRALSVLVISLTKNPPLRHHATKGNTTSLLNPISDYRIRLSTLPRDEIRDQCARRGVKRGREKQSHSARHSGGQKSPGLRMDEWQVRPVPRIESVPGPLMRYFIGHNLPFVGRPFVLEKWKLCVCIEMPLSVSLSLSLSGSRPFGI